MKLQSIVKQFTKLDKQLENFIQKKFFDLETKEMMFKDLENSMQSDKDDITTAKNIQKKVKEFVA